MAWRNAGKTAYKNRTKDRKQARNEMGEKEKWEIKKEKGTIGEKLRRLPSSVLTSGQCCGMGVTIAGNNKDLPQLHSL